MQQELVEMYIGPLAGAAPWQFSTAYPNTMLSTTIHTFHLHFCSCPWMLSSLVVGRPVVVSNPSLELLQSLRSQRTFIRHVVGRPAAGGSTVTRFYSSVCPGPVADSNTVSARLPDCGPSLNLS